ncbi:conserved hypothetical protein (plasmid) [Haloarcula hispanica ATCC 33960]|uniref:Uncharacterized protein n=2 Tax=Haloarcula hispanica TaxID=51589 RepID=G0I082_HALHT|nr:conserved hypothetical protein [Haloarcula hispanica ATCC 33960]
MTTERQPTPDHGMSDTTLTALLDRDRVPLLYHTARNMQPRQLAGIAERKLRHLIVPAVPVDFDARYEGSVPASLSGAPDPVARNTALLRDALPSSGQTDFRELSQGIAAGEVTFRNRTVTVESASGVDWVGAGVPEPSTLWGLQFHGFAFLMWPVLGYQSPTDCTAVEETLEQWLRDWDRSGSNRIGQPAYLRRSWTPHAVSLRILNLVRFYAWAEDVLEPPHSARLRKLVYKNAAFLSNHVEHDIGGNHLIENGAALVMAGLFFPESGQQWVKQGLDVLVETAEQFRADGGHFERSPMYHAVTVTRYLTVIDLLKRVGREIPPEVQRVATAGVRFLRDMEPPDGRLPLLNDSVFGLALPLQSCLAYARAVGIEPTDETTSAQNAPTASGYYWLGTGRSRLLVDGGAIGPPHLPAHSHNDHFAVLWWADGQRILTDTGVFEYLPTTERQYSRSVEAHNTVQYDDVEPIQTGGSYLFGRRIEPEVAYEHRDGLTCFDGHYRTESSSQPQYSHRRHIYGSDTWWLVWDTVSAEKSAPIRSRLHLDPAVTVRSTPSDGQQHLVVSSLEGGSETGIAHIYPLDTDRIIRDQRPYYPEFGRSMPRTGITLRTDGSDVSFGFLLSTDDIDTVDVTRDGDEATGVQVGTVFQPLTSIED